MAQGRMFKMIHPETHKVTEEKCVCRTRAVKMRVTIDYVHKIPEAWTAEDMDSFFKKVRTWCAVSVLDILGKRDCLCECATFEYLGEATEEDGIEWGYHNEY